MKTISIHRILKDFLFLSLVALFLALLENFWMEHAEKVTANDNFESVNNKDTNTNNVDDQKSFFKLIEINNK